MENMTSESSLSIKIARVVTKFTNPSVLSIILLLLIAFTKSCKMSESVIYISIIVVFYVLIPVVYVYLRTSAVGNHFKTVHELSEFLKKRPADILILAFLLGLPCFFILWYFKAPTILLTTVTALLAGSIVTALCNFFYRVSYHLTGVTILVIMTAQAWGPVYLFLVLIIPLTFWAKYHIREHTIPQLVMGMCVSLAVSLAAFKLFS
jgi:hypothetical protein